MIYLARGMNNTAQSVIFTRAVTKKYKNKEKKGRCFIFFS